MVIDEHAQLHVANRPNSEMCHGPAETIDYDPGDEEDDSTTPSSAAPNRFHQNTKFGRLAKFFTFNNLTKHNVNNTNNPNSSNNTVILTKL